MQCLLASLVLDVQSDILNFLAQESLAHAALIFATLAAAFTFSTGFRGKTWMNEASFRHLFHNRYRLIYAGVLSVMIFVSIYAFFRFLFYAQITSYLMNIARPPNLGESLGHYWLYGVIQPAEAGTPFFVIIFSGYRGSFAWIGVLFAIVAAVILACAITFLAASSENDSSVRNQSA